MIVPSQNFVDIFKKTPGALSVCEAIAIINIASEAPPGIYLELGTHRGKSAMSSMYGLKNGFFQLLDPIFEDDMMTSEVYNKLIPFSLDRQVLFALIPEYSTEYLSKSEELYAYVFVDSGSHGDGLPMREVKLLEDRVIPGGIIAFHDFLSQFVEVEAAYNYLLSTGKYEPVNINWPDIVDYVRERDLERGNESWHHTEMDFPCFVGALKRK